MVKYSYCNVYSIEVRQLLVSRVQDYPETGLREGSCFCTEKGIGISSVQSQKQVWVRVLSVGVKEAHQAQVWVWT